MNSKYSQTQRTRANKGKYDRALIVRTDIRIILRVIGGSGYYYHAHTRTSRSCRQSQSSCEALPPSDPLFLTPDTRCSPGPAAASRTPRELSVSTRARRLPSRRRRRGSRWWRTRGVAKTPVRARCNSRPSPRPCLTSCAPSCSPRGVAVAAHRAHHQRPQACAPAVRFWRCCPAEGAVVAESPIYARLNTIHVGLPQDRGQF